MAAPTRVGSGTGVVITGASGSVSKTGATAGNIVVLQVNADGMTTDEVTISGVTNIENLAGTDSAMTALSGRQEIGVNASSHYLWIGRALTSDPSVTVNTPGNDCYCRMYEFTGVNAGTALSDVIENSTAGSFVNGTGNSASLLDTGVTTLGADRLAVNFWAVNDDSLTNYASFTGESGGDWTLTDQFESATGTDSAIGLQTATIASSGTINGGSMAIDSDPWGNIGFAFIPAGSSNQNVSPSGLATASAFGTLTIVPGGTSVTMTGLSSAGAFGAPKLNQAFVVSGLGSAQAFGLISLKFTVFGLQSAQAFGVPTNHIAFFVAGLNSAQAFGVPDVDTDGGGGQNVSASGLASAQAFGTVDILEGGVTVILTGLGTAQAFGTIEADQQYTVGGVPTAQAFGSVTILTGGVTKPVSGLGSSQAFGAPSVSTPGGGAGFNPALHQRQRRRRPRT